MRSYEGLCLIRAEGRRFSLSVGNLVSASFFSHLTITAHLIRLNNRRCHRDGFGSPFQNNAHLTKMKKKPSPISYDRSDLLLNHNSINNIDPTLDGLIVLHKATWLPKGWDSKRVHWSYGNLRQELEKASKLPLIANLEYVHFSYKIGVTKKQRDLLIKQFRK